jgi:hypothetical protein
MAILVYTDTSILIVVLLIWKTYIRKNRCPIIRHYTSYAKITEIFRSEEQDEKTYIIVGILVVVTIAHVFVARYFQHKRLKNVLEYAPTSDVVIEEHLGKQIAYLKTLSEVETVQHLCKLEYYSYPGERIGKGTLFFIDTEGNYTAESLYAQHRIELEKILSNRVFRKSLQDLGKLPKNRASELLASELDATLSKYLELYNGFFEAQSLDFNWGESANGQPVLFGLRNKLFALVLIAGSLEFTDVQEKIKIIDVIATSQVNEAHAIKDSDVRGDYLRKAVLHNNLVLASGMYGTSSRKTALKPFENRFADHKLVDFSAHATEYDVPVRHGVWKTTPDKGFINIRYFDKMTYEDLDELRRILDCP